MTRSRLLPLVATVAVLVAGCASAHAPTNDDLAPKGLTVPATAPGTTGVAPWPAALHDARHSGSATTDGPTAGTVRWRRLLEGAVTPGPVVGTDGTIYAASNGGVLHALDPATGADRWTLDSGHPGGSDLSVSSLLLPDGTILWPTPGPELLAVSPSGQLLWRQALPGRPTSPASSDGHRVYVGDSSGSVSALDVSGAAHAPAWTVDAGSTSYGSVVTDGAGRVYTTVDSSLVALDDRGATGAVAWTRDPGDGITEVSAGLAPDGTALLGTNGTREWAYHPDGTPAWDAVRTITYSSPAVTGSGLAYVGDHSGRIHVYDVRTGQEAATYMVSGAQVWSSVVVDRGYRVYFAGQDGHAHGLGPDGTALFDVDLGSPVDSYPALTADGVLLVGARDGTLTAIG